MKYSLADTYGNKFAMNPYTREVVVKRLDERDHNTEVILRVIAQDKGKHIFNWVYFVRSANFVRFYGLYYGLPYFVYYLSCLHLFFEITPHSV